MLPLFLASFLFLISLLTVFRAPTKGLWYISILVTEFSWCFICLIILLLLITNSGNEYRFLTIIVSVVSILLYLVPYIAAYRMAASLNQKFNKGFELIDRTGNPQQAPFRLVRLFKGLTDRKVQHQVIVYDASRNLMLDFYPSAIAGIRPCIIVVHGGSWAGGNSRQLPELNSFLANAGYHVAAINYRLAPENIFPASIGDVEVTLTFLKLKSHALSIDINRFVLLGRSAGGQVVLSAADQIQNSSIKGVISYYGPADMIWGYANPTNKRVMDSRKMMEDYLGGTYEDVTQQYQSSSPVETASSASLPALLIYGENDPMVSYEHGTRLKKKYDQHKVPHFILTMPWATHGFDYTLYGPGGQLSTYAVSRFLTMLLPETNSAEHHLEADQSKKFSAMHNN